MTRTPTSTTSPPPSRWPGWCSGRRCALQAPPNLVGEEFALLLRAGIDDWGGVSPVTADHVNPERPWPPIDELAARSAEAGFTLRERLTVYPKYVLAGAPWIDARLHAHVAALADPVTGLADENAAVVGRPWQEPDGGFASTGRIDLHAADRHGRAAPATGAATSTRSTATGTRCARSSTACVRATPPAPGAPAAAPERLPAELRAGLRARRVRPGGAARPGAPRRRAGAVPRRRPRAGRAGAARRRRAPRRGRRRGHLRGQPQHQLLQRLLRGLPVLRVRPARARRRRVPALARRGRRPGGRGGAGRAPPRCACRAASTRSCRSPSTPTSCGPCSAAVPGMHVHAFSPMEIVSAAAKAGVSIREWLAELRDGRARLDPRHRRRDPRRRGALGAHQGQAAGGAVGRGRDDRARAGHPVALDDDVRPRRRAPALARAPAHPGRAAGRDRRLHRVRAAAVRAPQRADLPGGPGPAGADRARQPRRARVRPAGAARPDRPHPGVVGEARRRAWPPTSCAAAPTTWAAR